VHRLGKKPEANGEELFDSPDLFAIEQEYDDMVIGFYNDMPMRDKDLFIPYNSSYGHAFWQGDVLQAPTDNLGGVGVTVGCYLNSFCRPAPERVNVADISFAHMR
jgi:hypothetical protein